MRTLMKHLATVVTVRIVAMVAVVTIPFFAWPFSVAGQAPAPAPADAKAPGEKAPGKNKVKQAAGPAEGKAAPGQVEIDWDGQKLRGVPQIVKRLYRLKKSGQWGPDRLPRLCDLCLVTGHPKLKMYATWYQALIAGHEGKNDDAALKLGESIDLGYLNVVEMQEAEELAVIRERPEIKALIAGLEKKLHDRMVKNFQAGVDASFAAVKTSAPAPWKPDLKDSAGQPVFVQGRPSVVALARIIDDAFESHVPRLKKIQEKVPVTLLFWQFDPEARPQLTRDYLAQLKAGPLQLSAPAAVIGRKEYLELRSIARTFFEKAASAKERAEDEDEEVFREAIPFTMFFDGSGAPVHGTVGVLEDWQVDYLLQKFLEHCPAPPAPPPPAAPPPAAPPAEKPAVPVPEPAVAPGGEKPTEKPESKAEESRPDSRPESKPESRPAPATPAPPAQPDPPPAGGGKKAPAEAGDANPKPVEASKPAEAPKPSEQRSDTPPPPAGEKEKEAPEKGRGTEKPL